MTTWIFGIDAANPQHWDYAKREGFWDMTQPRDVRAGDLVYFWQGGGSLLGLVRATSDTREMAAGTPMPWNLDDDKRAKYRYRFTLDVIAPDAAGEPSWTEVKTEAEVTGHLGFGPRKVPAGGERWLWAQTIGADPQTVEGSDPLLDQFGELPDLTEDARRRVERLVAQRTGQARFRGDLMTHWQGQCIITGPQPARVLEAAHIQPYRSKASHVSGNGILLRADLHRLFDAYLLMLEKTPEGVVVRCSPELDGSWYAELDGRRIIDPPTERAVLPHPESLSAHQAECGWLKAPGGVAETINP